MYNGIDSQKYNGMESHKNEQDSRINQIMK